MTSTILQQSQTTTILVGETGRHIINLYGGGANPTPKAPRVITEDYTVVRSDIGRWIISDSDAPVNLFYPNDIPVGSIEIFQRGSGQITVVPISGATFRNTELRSAGRDIDQKRMTLFSYGDTTAVLFGDTVEGIAEWSIIGNASVEEGDVTNFVIWRPDSTNQSSSFAIKVTGTGFASAGFSETLVEALTRLTALDSNITFDGVDTLTLTPEARNPIPLQFFARPQYTALGNRSVRITISDPSVGDLSVDSAYVDTTIVNVSRPYDPMDWFTTSTQTLAAAASSGATTLTLNDVSDVDRYSHVSGTGITAGTYITAINGSVVTLSAAISANLSVGASISVKRGGFFFDFNDSTTMTLDGSNNCSSVTDKVNGYQITQGTANRRPVFSATAINSGGGLTFDGVNDWLSSTSAPLAKLLDHARAEYTIFLIGRLNAFSSTGKWMDGVKALDAHSSNGAMSTTTTSVTAGLKELQSSEVTGIPYIFNLKSDGSTVQVKANGTRVYMPATLVADAASGQRDLRVDDISGIKPEMFARVTKTKGIRATESSNVGIITTSEYKVSSTTDSPKTITMNQNLVELMRSGQEVEFFSHIPVNLSPTVAKTTTTFSVGGSVSSNAYVSATIGAILVIPRTLQHQVEMGIVKFFSNRYSANTTTTTTAGSTIGTKKLTVASASNVKLYQRVSGTGIPSNAVVCKVNTTTNEVWIDEPVVTPGVANGTTLTFTNCGFKPATMIDLNNFDMIYHDGFETGADLSNSGEGWKPYYGDPANPGTFATAYGALGRGSTNNLGVEYQWYLDVLNYAPWKQYPVLIPFSDANVRKGGIKITAIPTPTEIADLIGYVPPEPANYKYISSYLRWAGARYVQYGYFECRMKGNKVVGSWPAFWLTAANGQWPPEIDILEQYGQQPGVSQQTIHCSRNFNSGLFQNRSFSNVGEMIDNMGDRYVTFGVEVAPNHITFYLNREKTVSYMPNWDHHTPYLVQLNLAVLKSKVLNTIDEMQMWVDYVNVWRRKDATVTLTGTEQAETTALVAAMSVAPTTTRKNLINAVIEELKLTSADLGGSLWDRLDGIGCCEAHDAQAARIDWKNPSRIGTVVGSPTFTVDRGYVGVLNTSYIDMGFQLSIDTGYQLNSTLNQSHIGVATGSVTNTTSIAVGTTSFNIMPKSSNQLTASLWSSAARTVTIASSTGHFVVTRNHFHYCYHQNGALTSGKPDAGNNTTTTDSQTFRFANGTTRVGWWHVGDYLTPDDVRRLYAIIRKYRLAVGAVS